MQHRELAMQREKVHVCLYSPSIPIKQVEDTLHKLRSCAQLPGSPPCCHSSCVSLPKHPRI